MLYKMADCKICARILSALAEAGDQPPGPGTIEKWGMSSVVRVRFQRQTMQHDQC